MHLISNLEQKNLGKFLHSNEGWRFSPIVHVGLGFFFSPSRFKFDCIFLLAFLDTFSLRSLSIYEFARSNLSLKQNLKTIYDVGLLWELLVLGMLKCWDLILFLNLLVKFWRPIDYSLEAGSPLFDLEKTGNRVEIYPIFHRFNLKISDSFSLWMTPHAQKFPKNESRN